MALTKAEAAKLTNDLLLRGVIETVVKESQLLQRLPFMEVTGTAVTYNREATMPEASFYDVGDTWAEATPTFSQVTTSLKILGGDADVDNFVQAIYVDPNDIEAEVIASRAKSVAHKFSESFYSGDSGVDAKSFDGLDAAIAPGQILLTGTNGGAVTLDLMDELVDMIRPGKPDVICLSKRSRRQLSALRRSSGTLLETDVDQFGQRALFYDGIPLVVDDFISDTQTQGTADNCSSIYAIKFGQGTGVMGLEHGGIQIEPLGELETKDATRHRIKWYVGLAIFSELGVARLAGVLP